jgi:hypothetical protein
MEKYQQAISSYNDTEYKKIIKYDKLKNNKNIKKLFDQMPDKIPSSKYRITKNIQQLKYLFLFNKTDIITTNFTITKNGTTSIYGFLYSIWDKGPKHQYYCMGPTFKSQDGEYRRRFQPYDYLLELKKYYEHYYEMAEELLLNELSNGTIELHTSIFYPKLFKGAKEEFDKSIIDSRMPIILLVFSWLVDFHRIYYRAVENHIHPGYQFIIFDETQIPIYNKILEEIGGSKEYTKMIDNIDSYNDNLSTISDVVPYIQTGQKIISMPLNSVTRPNDINFTAWRELYINKMCSELVLNFICPSFPFINNWFFIQNADPSLYDNISQYTKYENSKLGEDISENLRKINAMNYLNKDIHRSTSKSHAKYYLEPRDEKFEKLASKIMSSIDYTESNIVLSNLAICVHSEYVNKTIKDIPGLIQQKQILDPTYEHKGLFSKKFYKKHMFEFIYSLYCMNTKLRITHGDLHLNNATIYRLYRPEAIIDEFGDGTTKILYVMDTECKKCYLFDHAGLFSMLIDFSRSIIGDKSQIIDEFGEDYADKYFKDQNRRILYSLYQYFPNYTKKNKNMLLSIMLKNFPVFFKILTAFDIFALTHNIVNLIKQEKQNIKIDHEVEEFIKRVNSLSESLLLDNLTSMINGNINHCDDIEWPCIIILDELFGDCLLTPQIINKNDILTDIFYYPNEIIYKLDDYDQFPELLKLDKEIELKKKYGLDHDPSDNIPELIKEFRSLKNDNLTRFIDTYERSEDVQIKSSWMFE